MIVKIWFSLLKPEKYEDIYVYGFANVSQHIHNPLSFCFPANVELSHIKSDIVHKQLVFPTNLCKELANILPQLRVAGVARRAFAEKSGTGQKS